MDPTLITTTPEDLFRDLSLKPGDSVFDTYGFQLEVKGLRLEHRNEPGAPSVALTIDFVETDGVSLGGDWDGDCMADQLLAELLGHA